MYIRTGGVTAYNSATVAHLYTSIPTFTVSVSKSMSSAVIHDCSQFQKVVEGVESSIRIEMKDYYLLFFALSDFVPLVSEKSRDVGIQGHTAPK